MIDANNKAKNNVGRTRSDRRHFLKVGGFLTSGVLLPWNAWAANNWAVNRPTAEPGTDSSMIYLSPFFLLEKAASLAVGSDFIGTDIQYVLHQDVDHLRPGNAFYMGIGMPFEKNQMIDALVKLKGKTAQGNVKGEEAQRLSVLMGGIAYRSLMAELGKADKDYSQIGVSDAEKCLYHDATLVTTFLSKGKAMSSKNAADMASLFREMVPRTLIRFHTIMPDEEMGPDWVLRMQEWRERTDDYYDRLAMAIAAPEKEKYEKIINSPGFMKEPESILNRVATFNRIPWINKEEASQLREQASSIAGKALASSYNAIIAINDYWQNSMDETQLRKI